MGDEIWTDTLFWALHDDICFLVYHAKHQEPQQSNTKLKEFLIFLYGSQLLLPSIAKYTGKNTKMWKISYSYDLLNHLLSIISKFFLP